MHIYPAICDLINQDLRHGKPETHPSPESRSRAIDGKEVSSGLKPSAFAEATADKPASPAATSPPSTFGFPVSDATPKFALWAKNTELRPKDVSQILCRSPEGRISVTRGKPKTDPSSVALAKEEG